MKTLIAIFIGGGLGSIARYAISRLSVLAFGNTVFPLGTLMANVLSSALLAVLVVSIGKEYLQGLWIPFLVIGFCGGFSTFSTFSFETFILINEGKWIWAGANVLISVATCLVLIYIISKQLT
ncbi:CrcB family protein [Cryomorpha ignava]|uniref:Fluoride-specific ion channel FluC n=1 Tax=Cryomorpha ignava TaxID=101383 RepID=A0A7K3WP09_9FLAO|nr:CrcB family protein [Cryomorpha ignava]NEN22445.1 CrcB family protein [Cryomorpha ignava]